VPDSPVDDRFAAAPDGAADLRDRTAVDHRLHERLERLPPGHPSSPYDDDGRRREPDSRSYDLDTDQGADDTRPFTDAEWKDHLADARTRLAEAHRDGLATVDRYAIDKDGEAWAPERRAVHIDIVTDIYDQAAEIPCEHKAIIAGGMAGAGKTTVLGDHAGVDRSQYLTINPDNIKEEMARRGLIPQVEGLSPMEASDLVHPEASYIAKELAHRARADGKNIIWDITMASQASTERRISDLRADGYTSINGLFVDIPVALSVTRADGRHRDGEDKYREGVGLGGRYVPEEFITSQADEQWGSKNRKTFEEVKHHFDAWTMFDNGVDDRDPQPMATGSRDNPEERRP
jgi:predicted ABC-type ATPase